MKVNEIFSSIQGEGIAVGTPATFIRFAGCNLHCSWCDTKGSWDTNTAKEYHPLELGMKVIDMGVKTIILTGGEPLIQPEDDLVALCQLLQRSGCKIHVETNGTVVPSQELYDLVDLWTVSPKLGSANTQKPFKGETLDQWTALGVSPNFKDVPTRLQLKMVIQSKADMKEAAKLLKGYSQEALATYFILILQPEDSNAVAVYNNLPSWTKKYIPEIQHMVRYIPQVHKLIGIK